MNGFSRIVRGMLDRVASEASVEEVLGYAIQEIRDAADCQSCGIVALDEDGTVRVKSSRGLSGDFIKRLHLRGMPLVDEVVSSRAPIFINKEHPKFNKEGYLFENPYQSLFAVPLIIREKAIGVLFIESRQPDAFSEKLRGEIVEIASIVSLMVYQGLLEECLSRTVDQDPLTSLYNIRYFSQELSKEVRRADTCGHKLTVLLASIGHIDEYNDIHGHPEGDKAIVSISRIIKKQLRPIDIPSRTENRFGVIFPEMEKGEVERMARTICEEMDRNPIGKEPVLTIRIGIASLPADARDMKGLLNAAERNLLESKRKGGNSLTA